MSRCQCQGIESLFDERLAETQLERVRRRGPQKTTRLLVEALCQRGVHGRTLLDIGGGVGTIQHQLLASGLREATDVDASSAYLRAAKSESTRLGFEGRVHYHYGNFIDLAEAIPPADIVTLDRVICCFDDMPGLVGASAEKARLMYGVVYPRDAWWARLVFRMMNLTHKLRGNQFRVFIHPRAQVEALIEKEGLVPGFHRVAGVWQVAVFDRKAAPA